MKSKKRTIVEKIVNLLLNILISIFGIILLISIYTGIQTKILGSDYTDFFGYSLFEVQTGSMAGAIDAGDWIIVKLTNDVALNDVITYELDGEYITHRIIEVYNGTYITKGDANSAKDDPVDQKQIIGKVTRVLSSFGIFRKTLFNPTVLTALIITLFLFDLAIKKNKSDKESNKGTTKNFLNAIVRKFGKLFRENRKSKQFKKDEQNINILDVKTKALKSSKVNLDDKMLEDELAKTSLYRVVSVDTDEVDDNQEKSIQRVKNEDLNLNKGSYEEDELEKTSLYRVISVDADEVDDNYEELVRQVKEDESNFKKDAYVDDELEKTSLYRVISVDADEVDDTLLEIAENELKEADKDKKNEKKEKSETKKEEPEKQPEELTAIDLELLKNNKKGKNIIDTAMNIKKDELDEIVNILVGNPKMRTNEATIRTEFIDEYVRSKHYNYITTKLGLEKSVKEIAKKLVNSYKGSNSKYNDLVDIYIDIFMIIINLEKAYDSITDSDAKIEFYKKMVIKYHRDWDAKRIDRVVKEIIGKQNKYADILEAFLESLNTNTFNLNYNKLSSQKDMYGLELQHNISFSKVYSDYIIDKTYSEGIVAEDKMIVLLTLLSAQLVKDMVSFDFDKKYILHVPESLYTKERKSKRFLRMIDDEYAKSNVIIIIPFEDLLSNAKSIKKIRKQGYKFGVLFNRGSVVSSKDKGNIYLADYIFVNKKTADELKLSSIIPEELLDNIVYEDIVDKVGGFGSD